MSSYVPPHLRKESKFFNAKTSSTSKNVASKKTFTITENEFPTITAPPSKKSENILFAPNSFVAVASIIPQSNKQSVESIQVKYDKSVYRKNYLQKKEKNVPIFPPRVYDSDGWMENDDYIEWFEYTNANKI